MYKNEDINYLKYLKNKEIVVFGGSKLGEKLIRQLAAKQLICSYICDNSTNKIGTTIDGIPVISFAQLKKTNHEKRMIIISTHITEIKQQLLNADIHNFISSSQIDFGGGEEYYDAAYFEYQQRMGEFNAKQTAPLLAPYIQPLMNVIEFGSGGGYLLKEIVAASKIGVEINDFARANAAKLGIASVKTLEELPDNSADVIISIHALEHVLNPYGILQGLRSKLKESGKIIFWVPNESCDIEYTKSESNNHLYTWNCLTLGNLFKAAGYFICSVTNTQQQWPPHFFELREQLGQEVFDELCHIRGKAFGVNVICIVATK